MIWTGPFIDHSENERNEEITLNQTLYYNMLDVFEQRGKILLDRYPSHFIEDVLRHADVMQVHATNFNFLKKGKLRQM